jgi:hypothetical protein
VDDNSKVFMLVLIPILSLFSWLLFRKSGHNYAENLIFHVLLMSGTILIFFILGIIPFLMVPSMIMLWMVLNFVVSMVYNIVAYKQFFKQRMGVTIFKVILLQIIMLISSQLITLSVLQII